MNYKILNTIFGWVAFAIATIVYFLTIEPSTSFWDCGEFIATAFKLEVGHPPGAPLFMIMARVASLLSFGDVTGVAKVVNMMSALASSFTILFLFWTITHLAKKLILKTGELTLGNTITILGSGLVGALAYTFSDTFWFSAVEGEVYATSSLFTAVVFWSILKWENVADENYSNRWLIFIFFLMGLSIGVHLLNLLAIPAIVFVYYFKKYEPNRKGAFIALVVSIAILAVLMWGVIPGIVTVAAWFELRFVNGLGMPFNSGAIIYVIVLLLSIVGGIYLTSKKSSSILISVFTTLSLTLLGVPFITGNTVVSLLLIVGIFVVIYVFGRTRFALLNTVLLCFTVVLIGYSSFTMIVIRSFADPPMDENNPENVFALLSYLNREQYGDRPLAYGQYYNAILDKDNRYSTGSNVYIQQDGKYVVTSTKDFPNYESAFCTPFPRMYSAQPAHIQAYKEWADIEGKKVSAVNDKGKKEDIIVPTFGENIKFFIKYQLGFMYFRYFMWNFAGRQNDIQGHGNSIHGNWVSGIPFIDEALVGPQDNLPASLEDNKARNELYMLPLILGLIGLIWQYQKSTRNFTIVFLLFFFTGIAIVVYLNQSPYQPRERDYAYAASFYAFSIWIGLGALALYDFLRRKVPAPVSAVVATVVCLGLVPGIMAKENWDDHDRSNRYMARDFARNYLESCAPNAVLITYGDNDTFPLWYAQEVEGIRNDVRVLCFTLFNTDWYVDQMARKAYDSDPVPFSLSHDQYVQGKRDIIYLVEDKRLKDPVELKLAMEFVGSDDSKTKLQTQGNEPLDYLPSKQFRLMVDTAKVLENGTVSQKDENKILPYIDIKISGRYLQKNELMLLDFLAKNSWKRPVYFTSMGDNAVDLRNYLQLEGFAYRLVPINTPSNQGLMGRIDTDRLYYLLMDKYTWGNLEMPGVYLDQTILRTTNIVRVRTNFFRLADALKLEGKNDSAVAVLDKCNEIMPHYNIPYDIYNMQMVELYYQLGEVDKANDMVRKLFTVAEEDLSHYLMLKEKGFLPPDYEQKVALRILQDVNRLTTQFKQEELKNEIGPKFQELYQRYTTSEGN